MTLCDHQVNVVKGLKIYEDVFTTSEIMKVADFINEIRQAGRNGELSGKLCSISGVFSLNVLTSIQNLVFILIGVVYFFLICSSGYFYWCPQLIYVSKRNKISVVSSA
jgi:hypothetical protein